MHPVFVFFSGLELLLFDSVCKVLGVKLDLRQAGCGLAMVSNTQDPVDELVTSLDSTLSKGTLGRKEEEERLAGRLQFASAQLFGRLLKNKLKKLSSHIASGLNTLTADTSEALKGIRASLMSNKARVVSVYVDACFDSDGFSGTGGVCCNSSGVILGFFSEEVPVELLSLLQVGDKETAILELEALGIVVATIVWEDQLKEFRVVLFTDNEGVRTSLLRASSANSNVDCFLQLLFTKEEELAFQLWVERVPSQSNPADEPSRKICDKVGDCAHRVRVNGVEVWIRSAQFRGVTARPAAAAAGLKLFAVHPSE